MIHHEICHQKEAYSHGTGDQIVLSYICALADDSAEVRNTERDESDGAADGYGTGYQEHYCQKQK